MGYANAHKLSWGAKLCGLIKTKVQRSEKRYPCAFFQMLTTVFSVTALTSSLPHEISPSRTIYRYYHQAATMYNQVKIKSGYPFWVKTWKCDIRHNAPGKSNTSRKLIILLVIQFFLQSNKPVFISINRSVYRADRQDRHLDRHLLRLPNRTSRTMWGSRLFPLILVILVILHAERCVLGCTLKINFYNWIVP